MMGKDRDMPKFLNGRQAVVGHQLHSPPKLYPKHRPCLTVLGAEQHSADPDTA